MGNDDSLSRKERAKKKSNGQYVFYSPDDDISSDEEEHVDSSDYEVDEDDTSKIWNHPQT